MSPFVRRLLSLGILALHCTGTLASSNSSWWDDFEHDVNKTIHGAENYTVHAWHELESEFDKAKKVFESLIVEEVTKELDSVKGIIAQIPMSYGRTPPISPSLKTSHLQSELTLGLYNADGNYTQPKGFEFAALQYEGWNDPWFGVALDSFDAEFEVEIDLSGAANGNYTVSLLQLSASYEGVGVEVDFQLYMTAEAAASMSFTTGLELSLKKPMGIMMPALDPILNLSQSKTINIDVGDFHLKPIFNATMPKLEFSAMLALRTVFSVTVESIDVGALTLDLPAFDFNVNTLTNKMSNCQTPPAGTPPDQIYAELIHVQGSLDAILSYELLDDEFSGVIDKWTMWNMFDECYAFLPGVGSLGAVPSSSKDAILTAKPVTTCTTDGKTTVGAAVKSLDRGDKAAIAVGSFIGISLIATLAFYGGRVSQHHNSNKHGIDKAEGGKRIWYGKVPGSDHHGGQYDELSNSGMIFRPAEDGSGRWQGSDTQIQAQSANSIWPRRKPLPYIVVNGLGDPSSTDVTLGRDIGASTDGLMGPGRMWDSTGSRSMEYGRGDISSEGRGFPQGQSRPVS